MSINYDKLAVGFLEVCAEKDERDPDEHNLTLLAFGMLPDKLFQWFMEELFEGIGRKYTEEGQEYSFLTPAEFVTGMPKDYKAKVEREMAAAIYRNAKMVV